MISSAQVRPLTPPWAQRTNLEELVNTSGLLMFGWSGCVQAVGIEPTVT
jgi:hypothetical protein